MMPLPGISKEYVWMNSGETMKPRKLLENLSNLRLSLIWKLRKRTCGHERVKVNGIPVIL
jgi:hypothetical protein